MEEAPENSKELSHSAHAKWMNECPDDGGYKLFLISAWFYQTTQQNIQRVSNPNSYRY